MTAILNHQTTKDKKAPNVHKTRYTYGQEFLKTVFNAPFVNSKQGCGNLVDGLCQAMDVIAVT